MPVRFVAHLPDGPALLRYLTGDAPLRIGREPGCDLRLDHDSVSRRHAELLHSEDTWRVRDLGSKNGSFVEGRRVDEAELRLPTWLRFGDVACQLVLAERSEVEASAERGERLRQASLARTDVLARQDRLPDLLRETLEAVCELSGCERGFLLLGEGESLRVAATRGVEPQALSRREFVGSVGALQRAMARRTPVLVNELQADPGLAARPSVMQGGLRCLLCLPLLDGETLLGAVYADSRAPGEALTGFDLDLLRAFSERAALWIAARREAESLARLGELRSWDDVLAAQAGAGA